MDLKSPVQTAFGEVAFEEVLRAYEKTKQYAINKAEWLKTEEGKEYNRKKAKEYYERHKDKVLEKRANRYEQDRDTLLNRAKEYYLQHTEEVLQKNKERRKRQSEEKKIEKVEA